MVFHFQPLTETTLKGHSLTIVARHQNSEIGALLLTGYLALFYFNYARFVMRLMVLIQTRCTRPITPDFTECI